MSARRRPVASIICLAAAAVMVAGCAETGDFGRAKPTIWSETILPAVGSVSAAARGEPTSLFLLTDFETELRGRAWRFVMPIHERQYFERQLTELVRTHILPKETLVRDPAFYRQALLAGGIRSPSSRYRRLTDDILADRALILPFADMAERVLAADDIRKGAMTRAGGIDPQDRLNAEARIAENAGLIVWVCEAVNDRIEAYRYTLEHLVIEAPERQAIDVERALERLRADAAGLFSICRSLRFAARHSDGRSRAIVAKY